MTATREDALVALYTRVAAAYPWKQHSRRFLMWTDVPAAQRPALYQLESGAEQYVYTGGSLATPKRQINIKLFLYFSANHSTPGATALNAALDAVDAALLPSPGKEQMLGRCTLGDRVYDCRITGVPVRDTGDIDGDGLAVVDVMLVMP